MKPWPHPIEILTHTNLTPEAEARRIAAIQARRQERWTAWLKAKGQIK